MMIGNYYCYDIPAALHTQMDDYFGNPNDFETYFSLLYTLYSVPNIILPFFGGYFVDVLGSRLCLIIFSCLISAGQILFAFGLSIKSWPLMFIGRIVYGFGGESLGVGNSALLSEWFKGSEIAFAFGLNLSIARLGSVINNNVSPLLAIDAGVAFSLWFGCILVGVSIGSAVMLAWIDRSFSRGSSNTGVQELLNSADEEYSESEGLKATDLLIEGTESGARVSTAEDAPADKVRLKDAFSFPHAFWVLAISCVVVYGCVLPFNNIASALLLERNYFMAVPDGCHLFKDTECQSSLNPPVDCPASAYYQPPLPLNFTSADVVS